MNHYFKIRRILTFGENYKLWQLLLVNVVFCSWFVMNFAMLAGLPAWFAQFSVAFLIVVSLTLAIIAVALTMCEVHPETRQKLGLANLETTEKKRQYQVLNGLSILVWACLASLSLWLWYSSGIEDGLTQTSLPSLKTIVMIFHAIVAVVGFSAGAYLLMVVKNSKKTVATQ